MCRVFLTVLFIFMMSFVAQAKNTNCIDLTTILEQPVFNDRSPMQLAEAKEYANWSSERSLVTLCFGADCFIVKACQNEPLIIDISRISNGAVKQIGWDPKYERIETRPIITSQNWNDVLAKWSHKPVSSSKPDVENSYGTLIRTRVWIDGQRYTVYEPALIVNDKPFYR